MDPQVLLVIAAFMLPTIVAAGRRHQHFAPIFVLNFLTILIPWTWLGWIVAMVWAVTPVNRNDSELKISKRSIFHPHW